MANILGRREQDYSPDESVCLGFISPYFYHFFGENGIISPAHRAPGPARAKLETYEVIPLDAQIATGEDREGVGPAFKVEIDLKTPTASLMQKS